MVGANATDTGRHHANIHLSPEDIPAIDGTGARSGHLYRGLLSLMRDAHPDDGGCGSWADAMDLYLPAMRTALRSHRLAAPMLVDQVTGRRGWAMVGAILTDLWRQVMTTQTIPYRTFAELDTETQQAEIEREYNIILEAVIEGIRFDDAATGDDLQARIDAAIVKADDMRTPWFAASYIDDAAHDDLMGMARASAEDALYLAPDAYNARIRELAS